MLDIIQSPAEKDHILSIVCPALSCCSNLGHLACVRAVSRIWASWAWCLGIWFYMAKDVEVKYVVSQLFPLQYF